MTAAVASGRWHLVGGCCVLKVTTARADVQKVMGGNSWQPRDADGAARAVLALTAVGAAVAVLSTLPVSWQQQLSWAHELVVVSIAAGAVGLARCLRWLPADSRWWAAVPVSQLVLVLLLTLGGGDPQRRAALLVLFPAVYAARQLNRRTSFVVLGMSVVVATVAVLVHRDWVPALLDALYIDAVVLAMGIRLTVSGSRIVRQLTHLEREAAVDPLTGLVTRRSLDEAMRVGLQPRGHDAGLALVLVDVDHFKSVNDELGHPAGDAVLVQLAGLLRQGTRSVDVACRLGGDELAVLLVDVSRPIALRRAEALRADIDRHSFVVPDGGTTRVTVSIGVAHAAPDDPQDLYACADTALYAAKRGGRNQLAVAGRSPLGRGEVRT